MPCFKALERLKKAKESVAECVKYKICPDCGGDLVVISIDSNEYGLRCSHCNGKFESVGRFHHTDPIE